MNHKLFLGGALLLLLAAVCAASIGAKAPSKLPTASSYFAASVMHYPLGVSPPPPTLPTAAWARNVTLQNLAAYEAYIMDALAQRAAMMAATGAGRLNANNASSDVLIVFPESGTGYLTFPNDTYAVPFCEPLMSLGWRWVGAAATTGGCAAAVEAAGSSDGGAPHAAWASCASSAYNVNLVINFGGIRDGHRYNTDVAFVDGAVAATYLKSHINAVPVLTQPAVPDPTVFKASFGVVFGMFTCYDLWFQSPVQEEQRKLGATAFVYPNGMGSTPPLMMIDEVHAGFSMVHQTTLVSAGLFGTGGAGTFHRGEVLALNPQNPLTGVANSVVVARVPTASAEDRAFNDDSRRRRSIDEPMVAAPVGYAVDCIGGSAKCVTFQPTGAVQSFAVSFTSPRTNVTVECNATLTAATSVNQTWLFAAGQPLLVPAAPNTPDAAEAAFCLFIHCDDPTTGCMAGGLDSLAALSTSLHPVTASVSASFRDGWFSKPHNTFPLYGAAPASASILSVPYPLSFFNTSDLRFTPPASTASAAAAPWPSAAVLELTQRRGSLNLLNFGVLGSAKGATWKQQS